MKSFAGMLALAIALGGSIAALAPAMGEGDSPAAPIYGIRLPEGYRDWRLVSVAHEEGKLNDLRAILGNDTAIDAFRAGKETFPDGTIIARLAWDYTPLPESKAAFGQAQSYVAVHPKNGVQFMVKDSKKYAATGGWGFAHFNDGKPGDANIHETCFACHQAAASRDFVFNRYAP